MKNITGLTITNDRPNLLTKGLGFLFSTLLLGIFFLPVDAFALDYYMNVAGGSIAVPGSTLTFTINNQLVSGTPVINDAVALKFIDQGSGQTLPYGGIDFLCPDQYPGVNTACVGAYPNYAIYGIGSNLAQAWFRLIISPQATPGIHTILIQGTSTEGVVTTVTLNINVLTSAQVALTPSPLLPAQPEPQRARWESDMKTWGANWCSPVTYNANMAESILFYDATRVYYQIADYTNDPTWNNCAQWTSSLYNSYVNSYGGSVQAYYVFPQGARMDFERTGNTTSSQVVATLDTTDGWYEEPQHTGLDPVNNLMRETSYALEAQLDNAAVNGSNYQYTQDEMIGVLGQLDQTFIQKNFTWYQPFMVGLEMNALIDYYNEKSQDPRIPYVIKQALDGLWNTAWRPDLHGFYYRCYATNLTGLPGVPASNNGCFSPDTNGPGTEDANAWPWTPGDTFDYNDVQPDLNNLISPAYAWMYLQTGDPKYREEADILFADGVLYNDSVNWAGKEFSQNYRWSFDYMKWRDEANAQGEVSAVNTQPPAITVVSPASATTVTGPFSAISDSSDNVYVTGVQFQLNGTNLGPAVTTMPFELNNIPSFLYPNGTNSLTAIAYDTAGNSTVSNPVTITIDNPVNSALAECPSTNIPTGSFQGCYYNHGLANIWADMYGNPAIPPAPNMGTLAVTRNDPAINFDWGGNAPAPGVANYAYGVVWQGNFNFNSGAYAFLTSVDGNTGIRVYIDGQMEYNAWQPLCGGAGSCGLTPVQFTASFMVPGTHLIRVETWHDYTVSNMDSVHLSWTAASLVDTQPPTAPANLVASAMSPTQIDLSWAPSTDNVGVAGYQIIKNSAFVANVTTPGFIDNNVSPSTSYNYVVTAFDAAGNYSNPTNAATITTPATVGATPPTVPTALTAAAVSASQINLAWNASTDPVAVTGYKIFRGGVQVGTSPTNSYSDTSGLSASTGYSYTVSAYDAAGNISAPSALASATTMSASGNTFAITVSSGSNGSISPMSATLASGGSQTFTLTPDPGYIAQLTVDGVAVTLTNNTYTLTDVTAAHTLTASFTPPAAGSSVTYGDLNGAANGLVTIYDAELVAQYSVGLITLTPTQLQEAMVSSATEPGPTVYDAFLIAEYVVGAITKFPVQS